MQVSKKFCEVIFVSWEFLNDPILVIHSLGGTITNFFGEVGIELPKVVTKDIYEGYQIFQPQD